MLEMIDLNKRLSKEEYKEKRDALGQKINELQRKLREAKIPTIVVFEGLEAAGKGTCINQLMQPLDPRGFKVHPIHPPTEEEFLRPFLIRFWHKLPARGRLAIFDHSWYEKVLSDRVFKKIDKKDLPTFFDDINAFEHQQVDDGAVLLKFWLHIAQKEQARRFKKIEKNKALSWKIGKSEWQQQKNYNKFIEVAEEVFQKTNTSFAPWVIVEAHDRRFALIKILETIIQAWETALTKKEEKPKKAPSKKAKLPGQTLTILSNLELNKVVEQAEYEKNLDAYQKRLWEIEHEIYRKRIPVIIAFEGCDAAGKGGAIRRITGNLDPRGYEVIPVAAPTSEELAHHYLWRFAKEDPKAGHITIFDRTWYGRVLVERIEGFCSTDAWQRAYKEINDFEAHLVNFGTVLVKFWLHIDQEEQLKRFEARQQTESKQWKITEEDWRNREKWPEYEVAINDMLVHSSTVLAPWTIVEANNKLFSRLKVLKTVIDAIEKKL